MTTDVAKQWEASLAALDADHERRLAEICITVAPSVAMAEIAKLNEVYRLTFDCMYDYFYAGVWK